MVCGGGLLVIMYQHHTHTHNRVNIKYSLALRSFIIIYQNHCPDCTESGILMFQTVTALQLNGNRIGIGDNGLAERHSILAPSGAQKMQMYVHCSQSSSFGLS